jgi:hypothetical protein
VSTLRYQIVMWDGQFVEPCTYYPTRIAAFSQFARIRKEANILQGDLRVIEVDRDAPVEVHYGTPQGGQHDS